jgi:hypothetical protein
MIIRMFMKLIVNHVYMMLIIVKIIIVDVLFHV